MKNKFQFTALAVIIALFLFSGCGQESKKNINNADENLREANENLKEAATDASAEAKSKARADWQAFINESDRSIAEMEKQANELKAKIAKADQKAKAKLTSDLASLEQKLNDQKAKLNQKNTEFEADFENFNESVEAKHKVFREEFKHDMNGLGTAFKDLFKENVN